MSFGEMAWQWLGKLLGLENLKSFESLHVSLAAPWAQGASAPAWLFFACLLLAGVSVFFYARCQPRGRTTLRLGLAAARGLLLILILLMLFEPVLVAHYTSSPRPQLWVMFDGTDSMNIQDELPEAERTRLHEALAIGTSPTASPANEKLTRLDYVQALLEKENGQFLRKLEERFRLKLFQFDRPDGVRSMDLSANGSETLNPQAVADQLAASGQVTALGAALSDLGRRNATGHVAGLLLFSDFDQNAGPPPLESARRLKLPVYTVGIGPISAMDLAIDLQAPLLMKKAERSTIIANLRQSGLDDRFVKVKVVARQLDSAGQPTGEVILVGEKDQIKLSGDTIPVDFGFTPELTGRFVLQAEVDKLEGEVIDQNNLAEREVTIRDDFLRLMYVEYEPSWEWRFIKEVFHRDPLVGMRGFRTFLRSADPKVRQNNELFLPTLTPKRSDFFANDVIFLGDMPASTLSTRFCEMLKEYVSTFGGGLVIVAGPRFGPAELAQTPLKDMLPVVLDPDARIRDQREFRLQLSPQWQEFDFMHLGSTEEENIKAWDNLGPLPWYQPVARVHPLGTTVLAQHPTDTCADGQTPQPLIAIRQYGSAGGQVVYVAFDETWRLRRKYGEAYYRQFWGQMIHRLGLSHALGTQKRFVARTDRQRYQADDKVLLTVEAYDANFEPLTEEKLPDRKLTAELFVPATSGGSTDPQLLGVAQVREGVFETRIPVFEGGEHRIRVKDPITAEYTEVNFQVTSLSAERRSAVRKVALERQLAQSTGGKTYELDSVERFVDEVQYTEKVETTLEVFPLWNTWLCFSLVLLLMFGEWITRKWINLP